MAEGGKGSVPTGGDEDGKQGNTARMSCGSIFVEREEKELSLTAARANARGKAWCSTERKRKNLLAKVHPSKK